MDFFFGLVAGYFIHLALLKASDKIDEKKVAKK